MEQLEQLKGFLANIKDGVTEDERTLRIDYTVQSGGIADLLEAMAAISQALRELRTDMRIRMFLPPDQHEVTMSSSTSISGLVVDPIMPHTRERIHDFQNLVLPSMLAAAYDEQQFLTFADIAREIRGQESELDAAGIGWRVHMEFPKEPIEQIVRRLLVDAHTDFDVMVFVSVGGLEQYLKSQSHMDMIGRVAESSGKMLLAAGDFNGIATGRHLMVANLWMISELRPVLAQALSGLLDVRGKLKFLTRCGPRGPVGTVVAPDFFELDFSGVKRMRILRNLFRELATLHALVSFASDASNVESWNSWTVRVVGAKTLEARLVYNNGRMSIQGQEDGIDDESVMGFYHWAFDDKDESRILMARKTIALHASSFGDFVNHVADVRKSTEAAHNLYLDQVVAEILDTRLKFIEFVQEWTSKDIDLRLKLDRVMYENLYGGFGAILGAAVGIVSRTYDVTVTKILLTAAPLLFIMYLVVGLARTERLTSVFKTYLDQHMRLITYYTSVLGKDIVANLAGSFTREKIESGFRTKRKQNLVVGTLLAVVALAAFFVFLILGYI